MVWFSLPVFLLMLGAAVLGFLLAWVWIGNKLDQLQQNFIKQQDQFLQVQNRYQDLLEHSNTQQGEKEKLIQRLDDQQMEIAQYKVIKKQLEEDKQFLTEEFNALRKKKAKSILPRQITGELASLKSQIDELAQEKENWREKYMIIRQANDEHLAKLSSLGNNQENKEKINWREEYHQMQLSLNKKLEELKEAHQRQRLEYMEMKQYYAEELENLQQQKEQLQSRIAPNQQNNKIDSSDFEQ